MIRILDRYLLWQFLHYLLMGLLLFVGLFVVVDLFENVSLNSASADYAWVNTRQIWGVGAVDLAAGKIHIDGYLQ